MNDNSDTYLETIKFVCQFDNVIIKSCYPNSNISSSNELSNIKDYYTAIANYFASRNIRLIIVTSPPLIPLKTNQQNALRARELSNWLTETNFGTNVQIFNLFDQLAEKHGKQANMLAKQYRRFIPFDSHPNKNANTNVADEFVKFMLANNVLDMNK